jgi:hypothetical protein
MYCSSFGGDELAVLLLSSLGLLLFLLVVFLSCTPVVVLGEDLLVDLGQHTFLEEAEQVPSGIQGLEDGTATVLALLQEVSLELVEEDEEVLVISGKGVLTDDGLHGKSILTSGVERVHLREDGGVILTSQLMTVLLNTDGRLHQTGK